MDTGQYLDVFIEETKENIQIMNQSLLQLEKSPNDIDMLNEIFRAAHTVKGMAGTMGFNKMSALTHQMENLLQELRNGSVSADSNMVDLLFKCLDAVENYLNNIIDSGNEGNIDYKELIDELGMVLNGGGKSAASVAPGAEPVSGRAAVQPVDDVAVDQYEQNVINKAKELGIKAYRITVVLNKGCLLKSARAFVVFKTLERYGDIIGSEPGVQDIEDEKFNFEFTVDVLTKEPEDLLLKELYSVSEVENVIIKELDARPLSSGRINQHDGSKVPVTEDINQHDKQDDNGTSQHLAASRTKTGKTVRVDIDRLDILMNLVSELIISKTKLDGLASEVKSQRFNEEIDALERVITSLHDAVMKVRMVPVESVFRRFPRMVRDISRELGKEIDLLMSGEETELDRTVIDEIGEPLIHLLRNSVDHGIEPADVRKAMGKPEVGKIFLRAYQSGNNVIIEVEDDGQGINVEKVRQKAIEQGYISDETANTLSDREIIDFLFRPSFSTAEKISDISGRGVGLDVVKTKIESLNGRVEVETQQGKGTKFIISLPLTLAIYQALLIKTGEENYAIALSSVDQIVHVKPEEIKFVQDKEVIIYRGMVVPLIRLADVLEVPGRREEARKIKVVVVKKGEKLYGLVVDDVIGHREIVIKSLGKLLAEIRLFAGATILGDGSVALILDVNSLV